MALKTFAIFSALECEIRPLLDAFKMKKLFHLGNVKIFEGEKGYGIVTGIGGKNTLIAIGMFFGLIKNFKGHCINFGIAGHKKHPIGSCHLVHYVKSFSQDESFYLNPSEFEGFSFTPLMTFDMVQNAYFDLYCHDMEGAYFIEGCTRFIPVDALAICKIISDNELSHFSNITPAFAIALVKEKLPLILDWISSFNEITDHGLYAMLSSFAEASRFTESEIHQLEKLLQKAIALNIPVGHLVKKDPSTILFSIKSEIAKRTSL